MNPERAQFLNLHHPPARMNTEEAAWYLGFLPHEIPILIATKLLKPLGNPPPNGCKYFALEDLEGLRKSPEWLSKASNTIVKYWKAKNLRKTAHKRPGDL